MSNTLTFWTWFEKNNIKFLNLNSDQVTQEKKEELLDEFLENLHCYCDNLYFEIGGWPGAEQELIITADGNAEYFPFVEELIGSAPAIQNWTFTAFMQPHDLDYTSNFEDVELKPLEIYFLPLDSRNNPKSLGFRICVPNYDQLKNSNWLEAGVYRILDTVLGEKSFALDINYIEIGVLPENPEEQGTIELKDMLAFVKWKKAKLSKL